MLGPMAGALSPLGVARGGTSPLLIGLKAYWALEEASGTRFDSYGAHHLTDNNTVGSAAGKVGNAASFVRASSQYLSEADTADLSMAGSAFAVDGWFNAATISSIGNDVVGKIVPTAEYLIELYGSPGSYHFRFAVSSNGVAVTGDLDAIPSSPAITTATWYYFACWYDLSTLRFQLNNGTIYSQPYTGGVIDGNSAFTIGRAVATRYFDGLLDEIGIWKGRVLTADERAWRYNAGAGRSYADLLAYRG